MAAALPALAGACLGVAPVAAHGADPTRDAAGIDPWPAVAAVTAVGLLAGVVAAGRRNRAPDGTRRLDVAIGALLVAVGVTAVLSVGLRQPSVGAVGIVVGGAAGVLVATWGGCGLCADVTAGAVALHRFVEGAALAAVLAAGTSVTLVGVVVVSGHAVAECLAVGGRAGVGRVRAAGAVVFVQAVFVLGVLVATVGLVPVADLPRAWLVAIVGGVLSALGIAETDAVERWGARTRRPV
ncbi:hypothetical protein [Halorientalis pallida]|uniref:Uncharacterized protein n=1 Tax=Halorientalis pallida TaxID=2479928 RepID=A0A498KVI8_9EURY|nr:hypothetical protein [Halorientalis pallida]RXK48599.1 hypothetical protein EAF64_13060 [Halorientalis pallida]